MKQGIIGRVAVWNGSRLIFDIGEEWRAVDWTAGDYQVSNTGRCRSVDRAFTNVRGRQVRCRGRVRKAGLKAGNRYVHVNTTVRGIERTLVLHVEVARAFHGERPEGLLACHTDDDPLHNAAINLRWADRSANAQDAIRNGRNPQTRKERCPLEHLLAEPNLVAAQLRSRHRSCISCSRARAYLRYLERAGKPAQDFRTLADAYYTGLNIETLELAA
jgi:hypothetical protein